jgi:transcriptional regulator with XRE-family HTH domain
MKFKSQKIFLDSETVSEQLRAARQAKNLKLEDVSQKLNISQKYLKALETGETSKLPAGIYGKKFLKEYAVFLGLDYDDLEESFQKELETMESSARNDLFSRQVARARYFLAMPKIIKSLIIIIIITVCFLYLGVALKKIVSPPYLIVENPPKNLITKEKTIKIIGATEAETQVIINGKQVLSDSNGRFAEQISLKEGVNIITITARKKHGREAVIKRQVLVREE